MKTEINLEEYELIKAEEIFENVNLNKKETFIDIEVENENNFFSLHNSFEEFNEILLQKNCDGYHIAGLLTNFFYRFWPELFSMNFLFRFNTPIVKAIVGKENFYFNSIKEFEIWEEKNKNKNFKSKDRKSTRLNSSHVKRSRMPSSA